MRCAIILAIITLYAVYAAASEQGVIDICPTLTDCGTCTITDGCGWCAATQKCVNGTEEGPDSGFCYGAWEFKTCTTCSNLGDCRSCNEYPDCFWCAEKGVCLREGYIGCAWTDECPCDAYSSCSNCEDAGCAWCTNTMQCVDSANATAPGCTRDTEGCPCANNPTCGSCASDFTCGWCDDSMSCVRRMQNKNCTLSSSCELTCQRADSCLVCNNVLGCGWCEATSTCVDINSGLCDAGTSQICPLNCGYFSDCNTCTAHDPSCGWCEATNECLSATNGSCSITNYCPVCAASSCESCTPIEGCGWCEETSTCVELDQSSCAAERQCSEKSDEGFKAGTFVGGIFLGIGLSLLIVGGAYMYRKRSDYQSV